MQLDISFCKYACIPNEFTINGIEADVYDFGEQDDLNPIHPAAVCGCMTFTPDATKIPSAMAKYSIKADEAAKIQTLLAEKLSFGRCNYCR